MANPIKSLRESLGKLPTRYRYWISLGILAALLIALPVTLIGLMTGTFELRKRAVTAEVTPTPSPVARPAIQVILFGDTNHNLVYDPGEGAMTGFNVDIWICKLNEHYTGCDYSASVWTNGDASVTFSSLPLGTYHAWIHTGLPQGWYSTLGIVSLGRGEYQTAYVPLSQSNYYARPTTTPVPDYCVGEGGRGWTIEGNSCCPGFEKISNSIPGPGNGQCAGLTDSSFVCSLDCGDGRCTLGENQCNCLEDCGSIPPEVPCGQSCGPDAPCIPGLMCGTPCPPGQVCAQYMRCYNPSCPYDEDCICGGTPTAIPCTAEGQTMPVYPGYSCCPGLEAISPNQPDANGNCPDYPLLGASVCVKDCGDGQCTLGENKCNCPEDCGQTPTVIPLTPVQPPSSITLKIRFRGVTSRPIDDSSKNLKIYATNLTGGPDFGSVDYRFEGLFYVDDAGIYSKEIGLDGSYFGHRYRLRIKGPKHLQSVFPDVYFQAGGELDLTYSPLRPGDLDQDGKVDINDIRTIDERIFSTIPADVTLVDVNFDGKVDIFDRALVFQTLSVQYDPD